MQVSLLFASAQLFCIVTNYKSDIIGENVPYGDRFFGLPL